MQKQYVTVKAVITPDGKKLPLSLTTATGETYDISRVIQMQPAFVHQDRCIVDRYSVEIDGQESYLYFERNPACGSPDIGRWYIETPNHD